MGVPHEIEERGRCRQDDISGVDAMVSGILLRDKSWNKSRRRDLGTYPYSRGTWIVTWLTCDILGGLYDGTGQLRTNVPS